ncbi:hypothetical protein [Paenarthrobacter sp. PH39-S1]|uniref:hypothetical protein n=1 Tax=Paenarthrobacter sp. PH39-S1 TaxID=3046204 RepID=UPI0024BBB8E9|nr:hypothetical protein [Paenarthrobacter sp. PH39-S1]MDJ0356075.1 hypothetical protein [Paenarthrobacter sp. PH39-S1]
MESQRRPFTWAAIEPGAFAAHENFPAAIGDQHGRLLWVQGDQDSRAKATRINFVEGADWSEAAVGTSAPAATASTSSAGTKVCSTSTGARSSSVNGTRKSLRSWP